MPAAAGHAFGDGILASDNRFVKRAQMELAYFSFYARLKQRQTGGAGVVLRFQRVRPRRASGFQPLQVARNHAAISRPHHPRAEALEIRHRFHGRGLPARGVAALAARALSR